MFEKFEEREVSVLSYEVLLPARARFHDHYLGMVKRPRRLWLTEIIPNRELAYAFAKLVLMEPNPWHREAE